MNKIIRLFLRTDKNNQFEDVHLGFGYLDGNVTIGEKSYINSGYRIVSGNNSKVAIGKYCAIGRNFSCASRTHSLVRPTIDEFNSMHEVLEADILIGNYIWIGDNVVIKEGVIIEDYAVIGANSVVTKNVRKFEIVGGVPAQHIRFNTSHYRYNDGE